MSNSEKQNDAALETVSNLSDESHNSKTENDGESSSKRQKVESKAKKVGRTRRKTATYGNSEYGTNDDAFFEEVNKNVNAESSQKLVDPEKQASLSLSDTKETIENELLSPGERMIMKYLKELTKDIKMVQRIVAEQKVEIDSVAKGDPLEVIDSVDRKLLEELCLPLNKLKDLEDFEEKLYGHDFREKVVSYLKLVHYFHVFSYFIHC